MNSKPWYHDGLPFSCHQCGGCCTGDSGVVWVNDDEIRAISEHLNVSVGEVRLLRTRLVGNGVSLIEYPNGDCTFFDVQTRRCSIYPVRPRQCRSWPFWNSNLSTPDDWLEVQKSCPGAGSGDLIPIEDIEASAAMIRI